MSQILTIHPKTPQPRLIDCAAATLARGGLLVHPTDTAYALGCQIGNKTAAERIRTLRRLDRNHLFTLLCRDLSALATYARVDNRTYRQLKAHTPGPFTFVLEATREVPRRLQLGKRKQIGLRVPAHRILQALLEALGEPILSSTLTLPGADYPLTDPAEIQTALGPQVDLILDGGHGTHAESTVVDMTGPGPQLIRPGLGNFAHLTP